MLKGLDKAYAAYKALKARLNDAFQVFIHETGSGKPLHKEGVGRSIPEDFGYISTLYQIESILMMECDIRKASQQTLEAIRENLGYDHLAIGLLSEDRTLRILAHVGYAEGKVPEILVAEAGITGLAILERETINVPDVTRVSRYVKALNGIRSEIAIPIFGEQCRILGVLNVESKHPNAFTSEDERALTSVANQLAFAIRSAEYLKERDEYYNELQAAYRGTLYLLVDFLEKQFPYLTGHSHHVAVLAADMGRQIKMNEKEINLIHIAGELHDIGKIYLPQALLLKADAFDEDEEQVMKEHARIGSIIASKIPIFKDHIAQWILHHHERYDGKGYPDRLRAEEIPLGARLIAVADAWDAMISPRPYKEAYPIDRSLRELRECAGEQFDPHVVETFLKCLETRKIEAY